MGRFHINKHGVPAPCKAKEGNCPLGDNSQHFSSEKEAQKVADIAGEQQHGLLPGQKNHEIEINKEAWEDAFGDGGWHKEDGMTLAVFSDYFLDPDTNDATGNAFQEFPDELKDLAIDGEGFVAVTERNAKDYLTINVLSGNDNYGREEVNEYFNNEILPSMQKHYPDMVSIDEYGDADIENNERFNDIVKFAESKLSDESNFKINGNKVFIDGDPSITKNYSGKIHDRNWVEEYKGFQDEIDKEGKYLTGLINRRTKLTEPALKEGEIPMQEDLDTSIEIYDSFITPSENDPVSEAKEMFDHLSNKKLYRYENEGEYPLQDFVSLQSYGASSWDERMDRFENFLEREDYFVEDYGYGEEGRALFKENARKRGELMDYTEKLTLEYAKDFEKNIKQTYPKYNLYEQEVMAEKYKDNLANKIGKFVNDERNED